MSKKEWNRPIVKELDMLMTESVGAGLEAILFILIMKYFGNTKPFRRSSLSPPHS